MIHLSWLAWSGIVSGAGFAMVRRVAFVLETSIGKLSTPKLDRELHNSRQVHASEKGLGNWSETKRVGLGG